MIVQSKYYLFIYIQLMGNMSKTSKITEGAMNAMKDAFNKDNNKNA